MRRAILAVLAWSLVSPETAMAGEREPAPAAVLSQLHSRLAPVFQRYYPRAKSEVTARWIRFAYDTRMFMIHVPLKTGEWQDAREVEGPNRHGILCSVSLEEGRYGGQALLPLTVDERYFETLVLAVASPGAAQYFYVHLSYPATVDARFLKEFNGAVQNAWRSER